MKNKEEMQKIITFGDYTILIELPNRNKDLSYSKDNNIICFKSGKVVWQIQQLLEEFSINNHLNYFSDIYFDITKEDNGELKCIGFTNHCIIDVYQQKIISIINNR
ncbi:hypothetical protein [Candidatus Stoquefichus sp. SB1]|uniref:hypothetical protein n=1 Tax=Candidatus Stoquefichus sp. SB1 TaxID=1658109 RepID=UPI00067F4CCD|nr:hypothetical protein [Candidatus Stoquefichus sp. SB1]